MGSTSIGARDHKGAGETIWLMVSYGEDSTKLTIYQPGIKRSTNRKELIRL
jgi:hypothetical protein